MKMEPDDFDTFLAELCIANLLTVDELIRTKHIMRGDACALLWSTGTGLPTE